MDEKNHWQLQDQCLDSAAASLTVLMLTRKCSITNNKYIHSGTTLMFDLDSKIATSILEEDNKDKK